MLNPSSRDPTTSPAYPTERPRRVVVAEDDDQMRAMLVEWLESIGCTVIDCSSGHHLLDRLTFMPTPDLAELDAIVTDQRMPGMTGLQALESVWFLDLPPVLLITAYGDERVVARARGIEAVTVLGKPFDRGLFLEAVLNLFESE